jgi:hypothetical protein
MLFYLPRFSFSIVDKMISYFNKEWKNNEFAWAVIRDRKRQCITVCNKLMAIAQNAYNIKLLRAFAYELTS